MSMPMGGSMPGILCGWIMGMGTQMMAYGRDLNLIKALGLSLDTREREGGREGGVTDRAALPHCTNILSNQ